MATKSPSGMAALGALAVVAAGALRERGVDASYGGLKKGLRDAVTKDPLDALAVTVLGGSYLFFLAERGHNPKITSYFDALVFISTNLSVGYSDIFARTAPGKAIASAIMTVGPAMSAAALNGGESSAVTLAPEAMKVQQAILDKLDAILEELRKSRS